VPPAAPPGSEADPTGFHLEGAHHASQNDACLLNRPGNAQPWGDHYAQLVMKAKSGSFTRKLASLQQNLFEALEKRHIGELDPFEVDDYIHHYHKQSQELYVYINSQSHSNASLPLWLAAIDADEQGISVWQPATKLPHEEKQNNA